MKSKGLHMIGVGIAAACFTLAPQSPAAKGGDKGKPGGEDPPPDPELPFTYEEIMILPSVQHTTLDTVSINDAGVIPGRYEYDWGDPGFVAYPLITSTNVTYPDNYTAILAEPYSSPRWINNSNQMAGERWLESTGTWKAKIWLSDLSEVDLGVVPKEMESKSIAINDVGIVVVRRTTDTRVDSGLVWPVDSDEDGVADSWFLDADGNGINDLFFLLDSTGYTPVAINASGQVLFLQGYLLTPDYADSDGDGNPWYADSDADGANDLLTSLASLPGGEETYAYDINDAGTIVGTSNGRAVKWDDVNTPVDLGAPTKHSHTLLATLINNAGQIVGWRLEKQSTRRRYFLIHESLMYDLNDLTPEGVHAYPEDMNNNGWLIEWNGFAYIPVYPEQ